MPDDALKPDANTRFAEPRLALNRIYTRTGDSGLTSLVGGQRVPKPDMRIETYGTVDELNATIGLAIVSAREQAALDWLARILLRVQHELFNLGSILATLPEDVGEKQPRVTDREIAQLEAEIDQANTTLAPLRSFVLPGGCRVNADLHLARTVCRRAERLVCALAGTESVPEEAIRYLNRLSDALFVWSRAASRDLGAEEVLWQPNATGA